MPCPPTRSTAILILRNAFVAVFATAILVGGTARLGAQTYGTALRQPRMDARLVPRGLLRIEFAPEFLEYTRRFSFGSESLEDGSAEPIGADLTADTAGTNIFAAAARSESAIRSIIGDSTYRIHLGAFRTTQNADIRTIPLNLALGLSDRLTFTANVPLVTRRMQVDFQVDSSGANAGLNVASAGQADALIAQLGVAIGELEVQIASGAFGCPSSAQCAQAQAAVARATNLRANLLILTSVDASGGSIPSFAPIATSSAGTAIAAEVAAVAAELLTFGATAVTETLPLPTTRIDGIGVNGLLQNDAGYAAAPLEFARATNLGDIELGLRIGALQSPRARVVLVGIARLPTGTIDLPDNYVDLGSGDRQFDVVGGIEAGFESDALGITFGASYTLQLPDRIDRRIGPATLPIRPANSSASVKRDLGDAIQVSVYPSLKLDESFRVFGLFTYFRKEADRFTDPQGLSAEAAFGVSALDGQTDMTMGSFGAGVAYRPTFSPGGRLPIEAGLSYQAAFFGSGGLTPKANRLNIHLRLFYNLFAPGPPPEPDANF